MMKTSLILLSIIFFSCSGKQKKEQKNTITKYNIESNKTNFLISQNEIPSSTIVKKADSITIPKSSIWSTDCNADKFISIKTDINNIQFTVPGRFSMNAQLKKVGNNKYEFYFTDFPPIIPLPDEMQNWENLDNKKAVGYIQIIDESKITLTWFGFYSKKTKKNIQTENPFNQERSVSANLIKCSE